MRLIVSVIIIAIYAIVDAEVTYLPLTRAPQKVWSVDSLFLGASMIVCDSAEPVSAHWRFSSAGPAGKLFLVSPSNPDSTIFIFHNDHHKFPADSISVVLGRFARNTPLYFLYVITDTAKIYSSFREDKYFSGQNRLGQDLVVSNTNGLYNKRWAVVGSVDSCTVEVGFGSCGITVFKDIVFQVNGVHLQR